MNNVDAYIHSPAEAYAALQYAREQDKKHGGLTWFNATMCKYITPMRRGEVTGFLAYSGEGKTKIAVAQAVHVAELLINDKCDLSDFVAYFTWDQAVDQVEEQIEICMRHRRARQKNIPPNKIPYTLAWRTAVPITIVGLSEYRTHETDANYRPLTAADIDRAMERMIHFRVKENEEAKNPAFIVVDYVQTVPLKDASQRAAEVLMVAERFRTFALYWGVPVLLIMQAARAAKERTDKTPWGFDAQWSSGLEHVPHKLISMWHPSVTEKRGTPIQVGGKTYLLDDRTFTKFRVIKDRRRASNIEFAISFDLATLQSADYPEFLNADGDLW